MRYLSAPGQAAIAAGTVVPALLVSMYLDGGAMLLNHSPLDLVINGATYKGAHDLGQVGQITDKSTEMPRLAFSISGVPSDKVAFALTEKVQGRLVTVDVAIFDNATGTVLDVCRRFAGYLNTLSITDGKGTASITVTSESAARDLLRPCGVMYSHEDQMALNPGDLAWQFNNAQVEQRIVFPARHWFIAHKEG